jgi:uncharacterized LabA/DUF88 family protein
MIFIDGQNLLHACLEYAAKIDRGKYLKIREEDFINYMTSLVPDSKLVQVRFYTAIIDSPRNPRQERYLDTLEKKLKWVVDWKLARTYPFLCPACKRSGIESPVVCKTCGITMRNTENKGVDVSLATDLLIQGLEGGYDIGLLVSGDRDFAPVIHKLAERRPNVKVEIVQFRNNASYELTDAAQKFHPLDNDIQKFSDFFKKHSMTGGRLAP